MKAFSIREAYKHGWQKFREHFEMSILTTLTVLVASMLVGAPIGRSGILFSISSIILNVAALVLVLILRAGYTKMFLRIHDGETPKFKDIFSEYLLFWKYLSATILSGIVVALGFILLIIPGIVLALMYSMTTIVVVDAHMSPIPAMKESATITKGSRWRLLLFFIVAGFLNIVGAIAFGVGLLVTIPWTMFATVYVYRSLMSAKASIAPVA